VAQSLADERITVTFGEHLKAVLKSGKSQRTFWLLFVEEQRLNFPTQQFIAAACVVEKRLAFLTGQLKRLMKYFFDLLVVIHVNTISSSRRSQASRSSNL